MLKENNSGKVVVSLHHRNKTTMKAKKFKPTPEMIKAAESVFIAKAYTETIRPIVEGYQKKILEEMKPVNTFDGTVITDIKEAYAMNDIDFNLYLSRLKTERDNAGFKVENDDFCPLLVAEGLQGKAEDLLLDAMKPITGLTAEKIVDSGMENFHKMVDLSLSLLSPFVRSSKELLKN